MLHDFNNLKYTAFTYICSKNLAISWWLLGDCFNCL